ncbi:MAG: tripartite tricarboxylate transporter permease [Desulfovibrio sp.]|jgi:putative tricarboxylic transport membrane protein|nr:tripartite tricarboxylate transporter permease [Desulfovibrio sp.]
MFSHLPSVAASFTPDILFIMLFGVFGGLLVGAIPGLTSTMAVALLIPVTFGMTMELSLALLIAVYIGAISGGLVAATLINIPGTPASVATTFDAYPMAASGHAGRALGFGVLASFFGSMIGACILSFAAPALGRIALTFNSYEYLTLIIFTLTCILAISGKSLIKGILSACLGILMSLVGLSGTDNIARFTYGFSDFEAGLNVMPVLIGMYAVSQILDEIADIHAPFKVTKATFTVGDFIKVAREASNSVWNIVRSSLIGVGIGILPGIGPNVAGIMAYSKAKAASDDPESFGKGNPDGIIASESSNNACTGGALVPLLTLGIPGDATTMMLLGAFMIHGVQPGPLLLRDHPQLFLTVLIAYLISTIFMLILQIFCIRLLIKGLMAPRYVLYPIILAMCVLGCFALNSNMFDVWVFLAVGILGHILQRLDFPLLPLILGLILGQMAESNLAASWLMSGHSLWGLFDRPVSMGLLAVSALSVFLSLRMRRKQQRNESVLTESNP